VILTVWAGLVAAIVLGLPVSNMMTDLTG